jgi:maleylacetoacetate isomerase
MSSQKRKADPATATSPKKAKCTNGKVVLHSYWRSSCSWRVRIALALKGVEYDYKAVHLVKNEQMDPCYVKALNPSEEVPTLEIDGHTLCQSLAIIEYLEETRPEPPLLPKGAADRAKVRQLSDMVAQAIQPVQNLRCLRKIMGWYDDKDDKVRKKVEWGRWTIELGFQALERAMKETAGTYSFGDRVTMADLTLVPQVYNANRFKCDMSKFPTISRVHANLEKLPAFQAAVPDMMPDAQL